MTSKQTKNESLTRDSQRYTRVRVERSYYTKLADMAISFNTTPSEIVNTVAKATAINPEIFEHAKSFAPPRPVYRESTAVNEEIGSKNPKSKSKKEKKIEEDNEPCMVYVFYRKSDRMYKIGMSAHKNRINGAQNKGGQKLQRYKKFWFATRQEASLVEDYLHNKFFQKCYISEYFKLEYEDVRWLARVKFENERPDLEPEKFKFVPYFLENEKEKTETVSWKEVDRLAKKTPMELAEIEDID